MIDARLAKPSRLMALGMGVLLATCVTAAPALHAEMQDEQPNRNRSCVDGGCHRDVVNRRHMHGPAAQEKCSACHVETDAAQHTFKIAGDPATLCTTCHSMPKRTHDHEPARQGNCTACHDPHGSDRALMLVADPARALCLTCHEINKDEAREFVHGPVAAGACILCHEVHSSWHESLLTEEPRDLCLGCHEELKPDPQRDRHVHEPARDNCLGCHDAHASDYRYQLHAPAPQLCFTCHESIRDSLQSATVVHGALLEEGGCTRCHEPHFSVYPALQTQPEISMCLDCHDEPLTTPDGTTLTNMAQLLADNPDHHGPLREGMCSACHLPHAGEVNRLLRHAYPPEFYAPYDEKRYALCFECHLPEMVQSEHGRGTTRFRDGDRNLHWLHVNRVKGRTCRACHEVHASANPFHIRDSVPFGTRGWLLEIKFTRTDTGGSCTPGCHNAKTYEREQPVDAPLDEDASAGGDHP